MQLIKKYKNPSSKLTLRTDSLDINGSSNPYADFAAKWQQATDRGETSDPMEETRRRILERLNNNTFYWTDTDGSIKQDYLTDDAAVEDYRRKSGTATPLNWEFNLIAPARFGLGAIGNGIRTGLRAMNTAFTPSTWLNPVTGAKLLSPTVGTIADAGIQGAFAYEGLNGLWNQGKQGTLMSDPANTFIHGLEVLPMIGVGARGTQYMYNKAKPFMNFLWNDGKVIQKNMPYNKNNYYREVSKEAIDDAITSGVIRSKNIDTFIGPYFGKGYTPWKILNYIIEGYPNKNDWISPMLYKNANSISKEDAELGKYLLQDALQNRFFIDGPVGIEAFPFYKGSVNATPTSNFTYWQKHPIIGWRQHFFNTSTKPKRIYSKPNIDIMPVEGNITTSDIPTITAENAASIAPELWTAAQDAAISRGDWDEVYRLSDLHLRTKASEVGTPLTDDNGKLLRLYRGSQKDENVFTSWDPDNPTWTTTDKHYAINYTKPRMYNPDGTIRMLRSDPSKVKNLYGVYNKKVGPIEDIDNIKAWKAMYDDEFNTDLVFGHDYKVDHSKVTGFSDSNGIEYAFSRPTLLKSADPITYDNFGKRIGLGDRHNFSNPDIRWGLFPWIFGGGTIGYNYLNKNSTSSKLH